MTFLRVHDGERFLAHHGQVKILLDQPNNALNKQTHSVTKANFNSQSQGFRVARTSYAVNLKFLGKPIYCEKSTKEADPFLIRVLESEEKARREVASRAVATSANGPSLRTVKILPLIFDCSFASCGVWTYAKSELVYAPQLKWVVNGKAKFREMDLILEFNSGQVIDFRYSSIQNITIEAGPTPSFIISVIEPPRFFHKVDPIVEQMAHLNLQAPHTRQRNNGPDRYRIPCLDKDHESIVGICWVYRIMLPVGDSDHIGEQMRSLQKVHKVPEIIHHCPRISPDMKNIALGLQTLQNILARSYTEFPFALIFQIQKLAQNGYLLPDTVILLLPEISNMMKRSSMPVCISAIRKLFPQIHFPGPDIEAEQLEVVSLVNLLRKNEDNYNKFGLFMDGVNDIGRSGNVAIIHKVKVTPSATYLYGPEPESNNRVLRKYSGHHDYFIRVQFCDEDGQPIRFSPGVSQEQIFNTRFKKVLTNGIKIADRIYVFLGFSHSSLRSQSCWFMAPFIYNGTLMFDRMLISDLGDFTVIHSPAKCAARIGQTFSDTRTAIPIDPTVVKIEDDITCGDRVFSDGVGTVSQSVWRQITDGLSRRGLAPPTCFQIRYAGTF